MPPPRLVRPRATYAICRRVNERRFLLRPDPELNQLFTWVLAVTAAQFEVDIHVATVMSTHFHLVVTVPNENVSEFMHRLDLRLARALQVLRKFVRGVVWELRSFGTTPTKTSISPTRAARAYRSGRS